MTKVLKKLKSYEEEFPCYVHSRCSPSVTCAGCVKCFIDDFDTCLLDSLDAIENELLTYASFFSLSCDSVSLLRLLRREFVEMKALILDICHDEVIDDGNRTDA